MGLKLRSEEGGGSRAVYAYVRLVCADEGRIIR